VLSFYGEKKSLFQTSALDLLGNICWGVAIPFMGGEEEKRLTEIVGFGPNVALKGNKGAHRLGRQGQTGRKMPFLCAALRGWARAVCTKEADVRLGFIRFNLYQNTSKSIGTANSVHAPLRIYKTFAYHKVRVTSKPCFSGEYPERFLFSIFIYIYIYLYMYLFT